jgi:5-methylcytosine-specific restriction protein A
MPWRPVAPRRPDTRPSAAARGYGREWQGIRYRFLRRNPECAMCGQPATEPHHLVPRRHGGTDDESNLIPLCKPCHSRITKRGG